MSGVEVTLVLSKAAKESPCCFFEYELGFEFETNDGSGKRVRKCVEDPDGLSGREE